MGQNLVGQKFRESVPAKDEFVRLSMSDKSGVGFCNARSILLLSV